MASAESPPTAIREVLVGLEMELRWLHATWRVFGQLFNGTPDTVALLNRSAQSFFRISQDALQERIFLILARISDPSEMNGKANVSIPRLLSLLEDAEPQLSADLATLNDRLTESVAHIRVWRNKVIAHRDLKVFLKQDSVPMIDRRDVEACIETTGAIVNKVRHHFQMSHMLFNAIILDGDGNRIVSILRKAEDS